jgi:hypothetical protein
MSPGRCFPHAWHSSETSSTNAQSLRRRGVRCRLSVAMLEVYGSLGLGFEDWRIHPEMTAKHHGERNIGSHVDSPRSAKRLGTGDDQRRQKSDRSRPLFDEGKLNDCQLRCQERVQLSPKPSCRKRKRHSRWVRTQALAAGKRPRADT